MFTDSKSAAWQLSCRPETLFSPACLPWSWRPTEMKDKDIVTFFPLLGCVIQEPWNMNWRPVLKKWKKYYETPCCRSTSTACPILLSYPFPHPCDIIPEKKHFQSWNWFLVTYNFYLCYLQKKLVDSEQAHNSSLMLKYKIWKEGC